MTPTIVYILQIQSVTPPKFCLGAEIDDAIHTMGCEKIHYSHNESFWEERVNSHKHSMACEGIEAKVAEHWSPKYEPEFKTPVPHTKEWLATAW
jgi:hypothetical protein